MDDPQEYDTNAGYDTQTGDTDAVAMGNLYPQPTKTYPHQPQGQQAPVAGQPGANPLTNQTTIQARPIIHPIYGQRPAQPPAPPPAMAPMAQPPVAPQAFPPQGPTLPATQQATGQTTIVAPRPQRQGAAATISVILGIISIVIGALPVIGIVAVLPGALGVVFGLRGMQTRRRNVAIFGILLSVIGIALAATLVA